MMIDGDGCGGGDVDDYVDDDDDDDSKFYDRFLLVHLKSLFSKILFIIFH